ncbi:hypothetical protein Droror1_Dr00009913 [Drosera rotundifolia]
MLIRKWKGPFVSSTPLPISVPFPPFTISPATATTFSGERRRAPSSSSSHQDSGDITIKDPMKHIVKIIALLVAISSVWIGLLQASIIPRSNTWLLPVYLIIMLGCYGLLMVGIGLIQFRTCPHEAILLQQDVIEAKEFLKAKGVDVGSD